MELCSYYDTYLLPTYMQARKAASSSIWQKKNEKGKGGWERYNYLLLAIIASLKKKKKNWKKEELSIVWVKKNFEDKQLRDW